ncbi:MAG TPA: phosphoribosylanthranilate isomerase [Usitatibacter sp.]|jgi:phosphoribosylanthranilate isomerase|nr:phosphoribosylanthranilate isomerase [Usitatibacter sp.]
MRRTRVKICGIREREHAQVAVEAGADAIGLVFYAPSPRYVEREAAAEIARSLPAFVSAVGLFVDAGEADIRRVLDAVPLDILQFHGDEPPEFCAGFGRPYVRAVRMEPGTDLLEYARRFSKAKALLLDAHLPGTPGGTGLTFDWKAIPAGFPMPVILSGGLDAANVAQAVREVRPWAVDVSSGVESARGVKDPRKIVEFIRSVRREDAGQPS